MLTKLLIFAVLGFVIYFMLKSKFTKKSDKTSAELVECQNCGTFVESSELKNGLCASCQGSKK